MQSSVADNRRKLLASLIFAFLAAAIPAVNADTERFIDYEYDGAGNIVAVRSGVNLAPPEVTAITPAFVNKEKITFVSATGVNLLKAEVTTTTPGLSVLSVSASSPTEVSFILFADSTAAIGPAELTFTTRLGDDTATIAIAEKTPVISTDPNPIVLSPDAEPREVKLIFEEPFETDQTFQLSTRDEALATVNEASVDLPAGETEVAIVMTGLLPGNTELDITQPATFQGLGIPVIVEDSRLPAGDFTFYTKPVGVAAHVDQEIQTTGPFVSQPVGVGAYVPSSVQTDGPFVSQPVGVGAFVQQTVQTDGLFITPIVGAVLGTFIDQVTPRTVTRGSSASLVIDGLELDAVSNVAFVPDTGITQNGPFSVNTDGTRMTVTIDVDPTAATGTRVIVFTTPAGDQMYSNGTVIIQ